MTGEVPEDVRDQAPTPEPSDAGHGDVGADQAPADPSAQPDAATVGDQPPEEVDELDLARKEAADRTVDLQRLQAEYVNYKRRVDRDRDLIRENATYQALAPITEVLDSIDRAREHGPLEEGLRAIAEQLERVVAGVGLVKYGAVGDPFDPGIHDALSHIGEDPDVAVTTCKVIARAGYKIGDRVVRAAQVLVVDPPAGETIAPAAPQEAPSATDAPSGE